MGIVILLVGPRAGEPDRLPCGPLAKDHQMGIDELAAVVGINPLQHKGELAFNRRQRPQDAVLAFAHHSLALHSARLNVHAIQGMEKLPGGRGAELQDEVDLQIAPRGHIPMVRLHRDQVLQERARAGGAIQAPLDRLLAGL